MATYKAPLQDIRFLLEDVFDYPKTVATFDAFRDFDLDTVMAMVDQVGTFAANEMLPLNKSGDAEGIQLDPAKGTVKTPQGFKELYRGYVEQGLVSLPSRRNTAAAARRTCSPRCSARSRARQIFPSPSAPACRTAPWKRSSTTAPRSCGRPTCESS